MIELAVADCYAVQTGKHWPLHACGCANAIIPHLTRVRTSVGTYARGGAVYLCFVTILPVSLPPQ